MGIRPLGWGHRPLRTDPARPPTLHPAQCTHTGRVRAASGLFRPRGTRLGAPRPVQHPPVLLLRLGPHVGPLHVLEALELLDTVVVDLVLGEEEEEDAQGEADGPGGTEAVVSACGAPRSSPAAPVCVSCARADPCSWRPRGGGHSPGHPHGAHGVLGLARGDVLDGWRPRGVRPGLHLC